MKKHLYVFIFAVILLVGLFLRFYKLGEVPFGFYRDESAIGYNAYSIMTIGKDEYGKVFPLYFKSFGDYKLPVYIYSTIPAIKLFGMTPFAVRFPSALFGFFTLIASSLLILELTKNKTLALVSSGLLAINPWSLFYNRATFEVSICLFLFVIGTYLLQKSFSTKRFGFFLLGTVSFIISLYGYNLTRLLSPLLFVAIIFIYRKELKYIKFSEVILTSIVTLLSLLPFTLTFFSHGGVSSAGGTLIFSSAAVKAPLIELRSYYVTTLGFSSKLLFNNVFLILWQYMINIGKYLSVQFYFLTGDVGPNHGIGNFGNLYLFELPLVIYGIIISVKEKKKWQILFLVWTVLTILVASLTRDVPQSTRSFFLVTPLEVFSAMGAITCWQWLQKQKKTLQVIGLSIGFVFIFYNIVFYFASYYMRFPISYAKSWKAEDASISTYLGEIQNNYQKIIIDPSADLSYTSILFFQKYSPLAFQQTVKRTPDDSEGFTYVTSFGKYEFRKINWDTDYHQKGVLLVAGSDVVPQGTPTVQTFLYPMRPVVVPIRQTIFQYPVQDVAYVVVASKP